MSILGFFKVNGGLTVQDFDDLLNMAGLGTFKGVFDKANRSVSDLSQKAEGYATKSREVSASAQKAFDEETKAAKAKLEASKATARDYMQTANSTFDTAAKGKKVLAKFAKKK